MSFEPPPASYFIPSRYWSWAGTRRGRVLLAWLLTLASMAVMLWHSMTWFDVPSSLSEERRRVDGNGGHAQIDFGGQWMMGRMIVLGHARELYHRQRQWEVAWQGFREEDEAPLVRAEGIVPGTQRRTAKADEVLRHDAESMLNWFMGSDPGEWKVVGGAIAAPLAGPAAPGGNPLFAAALASAGRSKVTDEVFDVVTKPAIGGPLYPPVHAFLYAPLGLIDRPQLAYRVFQLVALAAVLLAGLGVSMLTRGRIWWSVASLAILVYPGTRGGIDLGQNPTITLCIVVWGWALAARGYPVAGGIVWGLFAFKPVWALAFFLVPLLTRRWRFCVAMVLTGVALAAATLPFVGLQTWFDWLHVGQEAADLYRVNRNWIMLSRDLHGIPRRILHDFSAPEAERDTPLAQGLAWGLWGAVLVTTISIYLRHGDRRRSTGVGIAFLLFAAVLTGYRFMYYDILLTAAGFAALLSEPFRYFRTRVYGITPVMPSLGSSDRMLEPPQSHVAREAPDTTGALEKSARKESAPRMLGYVNSFPLTILALMYCVENGLNGLNLQATFGFGNLAHVTTATDSATGIATPQIMGDTSPNYPLDTFLVLAIWAWCAVKLMRGEERNERQIQP